MKPKLEYVYAMVDGNLIGYAKPHKNLNGAGAKRLVIKFYEIK